MMTASDVAALGQRLHRLTGEPERECVLTYRNTAEKLGRRLTFRSALQRFAAVSDRRRLLTLSLLREKGALCSCEIQAALGISHPAVSHQMAVLLGAGLVARERRGKWVHYRLSPEGASVAP